MNRNAKPARVAAPLQHRPPVRVRKGRITGEYAKLYPPDGQGKVWWARLKKALGTCSSDFVVASLHQLQAATRFPGSGVSEVGINAALAMIEGFAPRNEVEAALAVQMSCTHGATMAVLGRLGPATGTEDHVCRFASAAARLARAFVSTSKPPRRQRHSYSPELVDVICERIAVDGAALRQICQDASMPARSTLFLWLRQRPDFRQKYTFAKQFQIQCLADDMIDMADDRAGDWIEREGPDGKKAHVFNPENFRRSKQQIGALQWRLSKLKPKRYHW